MLFVRGTALAVIVWCGHAFRMEDIRDDLKNDEVTPPQHFLQAAGRNLEEFMSAVAANAARGSLMEQEASQEESEETGGFVKMSWPVEWIGKLSTGGKEVGRGSFGAVYLAEIRCNQVTVAAKELQAAKDVVDQEAALLKYFSFSPNFVSYYAHATRSQKTSFILMEPAMGGTFAEALKRGPGTESIKMLLVDIIEGVAQMHERGVVHRDLKPANVLVSGLCDIPGKQPCRAKVGDLGESCYAGAPGKRPLFVARCSGMSGTPLYMAPETYREEPATFANDVWAVGMMLYEVLFDGLPYAIRTSSSIEELRRRVLVFDITTDLAFRDYSRASRFKAALKAMLEPDPVKRMSAASLLAELSPKIARPAQLPPSTLPACWSSEKPAEPRVPESKPQAPPAAEPRVPESKPEAPAPERRRGRPPGPVDPQAQQENSRLRSLRPDVLESEHFFSLQGSDFLSSKAHHLLLDPSYGLVDSEGLVLDEYGKQKKFGSFWGVSLEPKDTIISVNDKPWQQIMSDVTLRSRMIAGLEKVLIFRYRTPPRKGEKPVQPQPAPEPEPERELRKGDWVKVNNGQKGKLAKYDADNKEWQVRLEDGETQEFWPRYLKLATSGLKEGMRVKIHNAGNIENQYGVLINYVAGSDAGSDSWRVRLDTGGIYQSAPEVLWPTNAPVPRRI